MDLQHISLSDLKIAAVNVRHSRQAPDVADILPSIRARGVLQPLLVRANGEGFEIVAGRRRYFAVKRIANEAGTPPEEVALPCAVMGEGDDVAAMEASLIENVTHLPMDDMAQYEAFARLLKEGRTAPEIAETFGVPELTVKRRLALANLHPKIRDAYRAERIDADDLKLLTLASKRRQKEWLVLFEQEFVEGDDANEEFDQEVEAAPRGWRLKQWLFDGERIPVSAALFSVEEYKADIVTDLFGEEGYFSDREAFWALQNAAIAKLRDELLAKRWSEVVVLERGQDFPAWQYVPVSRKKGGKVFITVRESGEVETHEGYLEARVVQSRKKAEADEPGEGGDEQVAATVRPELTKAAENYVALHRHTVVRVALLSHPGIALRLAVTHMIVGSSLWSIKPEMQRADKESTAESLRASAAEADFAAEREAILAMLGVEPGWTGTVVRPNEDAFTAASIFARLIALTDADVLRILTFVMGETLAAGSVLAEATGAAIRPEVTRWWRADDTFLDLIRDRRVVNAMLAEVAGQNVADGNVSETAKAQKKIIRDCLAGDGREKVEGWVPGYMAFPIRSYTDGGMKLAEQWRQVSTLFEGT